MMKNIRQTWDAATHSVITTMEDENGKVRTMRFVVPKAGE